MSIVSADYTKFKPLLLVIMGVSGCGKSELAEKIQEISGWAFQEGDSLHPAVNIEKMSSGIPLTDEDRIPWLEKCHEWLKDRQLNGGGQGILTCSALKKSYRDILSKGLDNSCCFVYLEVPAEILKQRLAKRKGHFMPTSLLSSQLEALEPPQQGEFFIKIHVENESVEEVADNTLWALWAMQQASLELEAGG